MNRSHFDEVFNAIIKLWPQSIDSSIKTISSHGGANIPELIKSYDSVEEKLAYIKGFDLDDINLVDWAIYTVMHSYAKKFDTIYPHEIFPDEVYKVASENSEF